MLHLHFQHDFQQFQVWVVLFYFCLLIKSSFSEVAWSSHELKLMCNLSSPSRAQLGCSSEHLWQHVKYIVWYLRQFIRWFAMVCSRVGPAAASFLRDNSLFWNFTFSEKSFIYAMCRLNLLRPSDKYASKRPCSCWDTLVIIEYRHKIKASS